MEEFVADYESGALHPADVKQALVKAVNMLLQVTWFLYLFHSDHILFGQVPQFHFFVAELGIL
jgi:hypothetical protein